MGVFWIVAVIGVLAVAAKVYQLYIAPKQAQAEADHAVSRAERILSSVDGFTASQWIVSADRRTIIAVDEATRNVCLMDDSNGAGRPHVYAPADVLAAEIIEDGVTLTQTSRGGQVAGALVGGALLGGVGAVIGGLSANTTSSNRTQRVDLKIVVNDIAQPVWVVPFLFIPAGVDKNTTLYLDSRQNAFHWHAILGLVVKHAV